MPSARAEFQASITCFAKLRGLNPACSRGGKVDDSRAGAVRQTECDKAYYNFREQSRSVLNGPKKGCGNLRILKPNSQDMKVGITRWIISSESA
jgi:hypothetical protein